MKTLVIIVALLSLAGYPPGQAWQLYLSSNESSVVMSSWIQEAADFFFTVFEKSPMPPRWMSEQWSDFHGWLHISSDMVIWISYFSISFILTYFFVRKRNESLPFRHVMFLFIAFIMACGFTHLLDALTFWMPYYKLSTLIRLLTATFSVATVFALIKIAPRVIDLKTPAVMEDLIHKRTAELQAVNLRLQEEVRQRELVEQKLMLINRELEQKSSILQATNNALSQREHDIIEREENIRQLNLDLEKKVTERTDQLHIINQELEAFTYSVSHDLRAPLRAINGYAKILEEDYNPRLDAQGKHLINVITKNARYMGQLIDDLLEFSRTSRAELIKTIFHSDEEVRKVVSDLMVQEKNRSVEIAIHVMEKCHGDITMLRQVWVNLISNALKYSRKTEHARIEIGSTRLANEVQFYVKDNGVGFNMTYIEKLFGVFQRLHKKEEFEGTGVGLALVKRILDRHNGRIWAVAELHKGATFYFSLPI
jgi:signal transduction histidine kinase